jgi:hypothetical protein
MSEIIYPVNGTSVVSLVTPVACQQVVIKNNLSSFYVTNHLTGEINLLVPSGGSYTFRNNDGYASGATVGSVSATTSGASVFEATYLPSGGVGLQTLVTPQLAPPGQFVTGINPDGTVETAAGGGGGPTLETNGTPNASQALLNIKSSDASVTLTNSGGDVNLQVPAPPAFQVGGTPNTSQAVLNLESTNNTVTIANPSSGNVDLKVTTTRSLQFVIDGGGSTPSTGAKGQISIPYACTITGWVLTADVSGAAVVDVLRSTYSGFPSTSSIAGSDKPTLSSAQKNENLGPLSGWGSTAISAGDELQVNVNSATTVTRLNLTLVITVP